MLGMSIGIILSHQPLDMGELFMQVVIPLFLLLEVMILLSGLILPQDPYSYGLQGNNHRGTHSNIHNLLAMMQCTTSYNKKSNWNRKFDVLVKKINIKIIQGCVLKGKQGVALR